MKIYYKQTDRRYGKQWRECLPEKETSQSWLYPIGIRIFKKDLRVVNTSNGVTGYYIEFDLETAERNDWVRKNQYSIGGTVQRRTTTYDQLKKIAEIVGYQEENN